MNDPSRKVDPNAPPPRHDDADPLAETLGAEETGASAAPAAPPPSRSDLAARYRMRDLLGLGGMGEVLLADDLRVGREVAVKRQRAGGAPSSPSFARFLREAKIQGRLEHPAIVPVHDIGIDEAGDPYFVMKRLTGTTLAEILERQARGAEDALARWPRRLLLSRFADVCLAIAFAHGRGVIHRDIKPANIMLGDYGEVYVLDWGIAKIASDSGEELLSSERGGHAAEDGALTGAGTVLGTPGYMAPEQIRSGAVDERADVYSLGCVLFEILTREPLHPGGIAALRATLASGPAHPAARCPDADVPPELDDACACATARDPDDRLRSAQDLHRAVMRYLDGDRDLLLRRELSEQHTAAAEKALAGDGGAPDRAAAMREAGRALALDPTNVRAADLVSRMMLEPPAETPPEVEAAISDAAARAGAEQSRTATWVYVVMLACLPAILPLGIKSWRLLGAVAGCVVLMIGLTSFLGRKLRVRQVTLAAGVALDAALTVLLGLLYSPVLIVPVLAMSSALVFLTHPRLRAQWVPVLAAVAAIVTGVFGELAGLWPRTFAIDEASITVRSWALGAHPVGTLAVFSGFWLSAVLTGCATIWKVRRSQEAAERRLQLQAWHLRHLVPLRSLSD